MEIPTLIRMWICRLLLMSVLGWMLLNWHPFGQRLKAMLVRIMVGHLWVSAFDSQEIPSSLSYNIVTRLLREDMGYDGIIMTDAMDMDAIDTVYSPETAARLAIEAGHDLIAIGAHVNPQVIAEVIQSIVDAVKDGGFAGGTD